MASTLDLFDIAMSFDFRNVVTRYRNKYSLSFDEAEEVKCEFCKFISLSLSNPNNNYQIVGKVDSFWHEFLLFTNEYNEFCRNLGNGFIHHIPHTPFEKDSTGISSGKFHPTVKLGYEKLLEDYSRTFRNVPPTHILIPDLEKYLEQDTGTDGGGSPGCGCSPDMPANPQ